MTKEEHVELIKEYVQMPEEKLDAIINTGMFNSIIEGYLVLTLKAMGKSEDEQIKAQYTLKRILDEVTATEARKEA